MPPDQLASLRRAAAKAAQAHQNRDDTIRAANLAGIPIRVIADAVGLSPARVHQILHRR